MKIITSFNNCLLDNTLLIIYNKHFCIYVQHLINAINKNKPSVSIIIGDEDIKNTLYGTTTFIVTL